MYQHKQNV